jgi:hypothetical protein
VDARKGGSNVGTELCGLNTHVAPATGDDDDRRARRDNGTESGSVGREAGFTRRGIVGGLLAEILFDPPLVTAHEVGPALRRSRSTVTEGVGVPRNATSFGPVVALADGVGEGCAGGWIVVRLPMGTAADTGGDDVWSSVKATRITVSGATMMRAIPEGPTRRAAFPVRLGVLRARTLRWRSFSSREEAGQPREPADFRT